MIGISAYCGSQGGNLRIDSLKKESHIKVSHVFSDSNIRLLYSSHDNYPVRTIDTDEVSVVIEGCIYNLSDDTIGEWLTSINSNKGSVESVIQRIVEEADGDYIILCYNKIDNKLFVFNDILGGIPIYWTETDSAFIISRSLNFIYDNSTVHSFSKENIAEYLSFGYSIGDHTIFKDVFKLKPSSCIVVDTKTHSLLKNFEVIQPDFSIKNKYRTKKEAISDLLDKYLKGIKQRVEYINNHNLGLANTMSGGYDSRMVLGGLEKFVDDYINVTYQYTQDESEVVLSVLKAIESKCKYIKNSFTNTPILDDSDLTYKTEGKIPNVYVNSIVYNETKYTFNSALKGRNVFLFGGFGGEYIRHPRFPSLMPNSYIGYMINPPITVSSKVCNTTSEKVENSIMGQIATYSKQDKQSFCKYLYNEYYQNLVRGAGEDRYRLFFFTVQPLMSKDFILSIRNRLPLYWTGYRFCTLFMKGINKHLVDVGLFGGQVNLQSNFSLMKKDFKMKQPLTKFYKDIRRKIKGLSHARLVPAFPIEKIVNEYNELGDGKILFDIDFIKGVYTQIDDKYRYRILGIMQYIKELEKIKK